jgi:hypothetical protein
MRAALGWFSHLPALTRRSILIKGLIAAAVAFVVGMAAVYGVEQVIGNSLSCGIWAKCPQGATPGIKLGGGDGTGASSSISLGRARTRPSAPGNKTQNRALQQSPAQQSPAQQSPAQQNPLQQNPSQRNPSGQGVNPGRQPAPQDNPQGSPKGRGILGPDNPVEQKPHAQPGGQNSASPAPGGQPPSGGGGAPAEESASPSAPSH